MDLTILQVKASELKAAAYNPRKWADKDIEDLKASIKEFGLVDPIIVNSAPKRMNVVIGGHFRLHVAKLLGLDVVPVAYVNIPEVKREKELNLRLNKNAGSWDWELLKGFDEDLLSTVGFTEDEMRVGFGMSDADGAEVDEERMELLTINPPEAPRLKERAAIHFDTMEEYLMVKKAVDEGKITAKKILELA